MYQENRNPSQYSPQANGKVLIDLQLDALKSISRLLDNEIRHLDDFWSDAAEEIAKGNSISLFEEVEKLETRLIQSALIKTFGKQTAAAKLLGLKQTTLNEKIKRYKINMTDSANQK